MESEQVKEEDNPDLSSSLHIPSVSENDQPMESPPAVQIMEHPASRIPSSVFSGKPTNPADWSATSDESLFSIHMGNNSFSMEFDKAGELSRPEDWNTGMLRLEERNAGLPPVVEASSHEESCALLDEPPENQYAETTGTVTCCNPSPARLSFESRNSASSFAFPILANDSTKTAASLKVVQESSKEPQPQLEETNASSQTGWCSWLPCRPGWCC